jgi:hypothetical protein
MFQLLNTLFDVVNLMKISSLLSKMGDRWVSSVNCLFVCLFVHTKSSWVLSFKDGDSGKRRKSADLILYSFYFTKAIDQWFFVH